MASKDKKDKKKKVSNSSKSLHSISSDQVKVRVYATFGGNVNHLKVEFTAEERKNAGGGYFFENEKMKFVKDVDFNKSDIYKSLELQLKLNHLTREKKLEKLDEKIKYQKKLVGYLQKYPKLNAIRNSADEKLKLHDYEVLMDQIKKNAGEGAFYTMEDGARVYSFVKEDGDYIPLYWNRNENCQSPNNVTNNRTFIMENKIFDMEMGERIKRKLQISSITTLLVVLVIWMIANFVFTGYLVNKNAEMENTCQQSAINCAEASNSANANMINFINNECVEKLINEIEQNRELEQSKINNSSGVTTLTK